MLHAASILRDHRLGGVGAGDLIARDVVTAFLLALDPSSEARRGLSWLTSQEFPSLRQPRPQWITTGREIPLVQDLLQGMRACVVTVATRLGLAPLTDQFTQKLLELFCENVSGRPTTSKVPAEKEDSGLVTDSTWMTVRASAFRSSIPSFGVWSCSATGGMTRRGTPC